ncbi:cytochrome P450 [Parachaetomium inaequale]|uniref:Cytochrome P450 n=1 Tax=Parachaetomium inaequale TaxID=2588326 RepID=A0AAN6PK59_9PEZI|nr:cytochrome P450 [Parachaetomium inaequale]
MPAAQENPSGFIPLELTGALSTRPMIVLGLLATLVVVLNWTAVQRMLRKAWLRRHGYLQNYEGKPIPEVKGESRFSRFSHGYELSREGSKLAGDEPYIIWNGTHPEVVLTQAEHVREFYSKRSQEHFKPENANMGHYFGRVMGVCAGVQNGAVWKNIRKVFDPYFSYKSAMGFSEIFATEFKKWMDDLASQAGRKSEFVVEATTVCTVLPFKLIALACYGPAMTDKRVLLTTWFGRKQRSRLFNLLPTASKKDMDTFESDWKQFNFFMMRESEAKGLPCPAREMYHDVLAGTITEANWLQTIDEILFTNLDVTSAILAFLLINLSINQPVQQELRAEILESLGASPTTVADMIDSNKNPLEAYIRKTDTLLEYTCIESGRLCPAVWFTLPEYAGADLDIGGYRVPAGTSCIIDWARLNTESRLWNPEPNRDLNNMEQAGPEVTGRVFYPQRFRGMSPTTYRWSMLRFGLGGRQCIGKNFAARIMKQFLVEVLTRYRVELDGERPVKQWGTINVELREDRFTVMPKQNVRFVRI